MGRTGASTVNASNAAAVLQALVTGVKTADCSAVVRSSQPMCPDRIESNTADEEGVV